MSKLIDDESLLSKFREQLCTLNVLLEDSRERKDWSNVQYYTGYRDAVEEMYFFIANNRISQRPHV